LAAVFRSHLLHDIRCTDLPHRAFSSELRRLFVAVLSFRDLDTASTPRFRSFYDVVFFRRRGSWMSEPTFFFPFPSFFVVWLLSGFALLDLGDCVFGWRAIAVSRSHKVLLLGSCPGFFENSRSARCALFRDQWKWLCPRDDA